MHANLNELKQLYKAHLKINKKFLELDDFLKIFKDFDGLSPSQATYCFGMSKMTVALEKEKSKPPGYMEHDFVEFLEAIGRVAFLKF